MPYTTCQPRQQLGQGLFCVFIPNWHFIIYIEVIISLDCPYFVVEDVTQKIFPKH